MIQTRKDIYENQQSCVPFIKAEQEVKRCQVQIDRKTTIFPREGKDVQQAKQSFISRTEPFKNRVFISELQIN